MKLLGLLKGAMLLATLALVGTIDQSAAETTASITQERAYFMRLEALTKDLTTTLVWCAQGKPYSVGDILVDCRPTHAPIMGAR